MTEQKYQRLTRSIRSSLWLGSDHLLLVVHVGYTELYKRFYFRDIQAIIVQETSRRTIWNGVLMVPISICLIGLIISMVPETNVIAVIVWSILAALFLLPFVINNLRGTACACRLRTAVQTEHMTSLNRVRQTRNVLEKIRPLLIAAQGQLSASEVSARMHEAVSGVAPTSTPPILS